ncbi:MAG: DNA polymerase IV [Deltaproteobacteria bacterium]|nr:MAG: DNA polymerase IV [Deltaproteobacteria bacterium]
MTDRIILHVDLDAFFASVEQRINPTLRGKAIAVSGGGKRTVVVTSSYEARARGVKTGMTIHEARRHCPELIFIIGNNNKYIDSSVKIITILEDFTPLVEVFSIDEAFLDITACQRLFGSPEIIARLIKRRIKGELGLTCSIGIAPNKLLAKLASGMEKPEGLVMIRPEEIENLLDRLPVEKLCGIGDKLAKHLSLLGIRSAGDLGRFPEGTLTKRFGVIGHTLHLMGLGIDENPVVPYQREPEAKSVGHSTTLERDISSEHQIASVLWRLSEMVGRRMRRERFSGRTIALTVRYEDFFTLTKRRTLVRYIEGSQEIFEGAWGIFQSIVHRKAVRLLGVSVTNLSHCQQLLLFEEESKKLRITRAMDRINDRWGEFTVTWAGLLDRSRGKGIISPSWRPEENQILTG